MKKAIICICSLLIFISLVPAAAYAGKYVTNKWDKKNAVKNGGWHVAYGRELTETDAIRGGVAAGVSIYSGNSGPFIAWMENLIEESITGMERALGSLGNEISRDAKRRARDLAMHTIKDLLRGKRPGVSDILRMGKIEFKVGTSQYNGKNREWDPTKDCNFRNFTDCGGYRTISTTVAFVPYVAFRIRSGSGTSSGKAYNYKFTNNCSSPIRLAIRYKNVLDNWVTDGWWDFSPRESSFLATGGTRLASSNSIWYYYAEPTDNSGRSWGGNTKVTFKGRKLKMKKKQDNKGHNDWSIKCD